MPKRLEEALKRSARKQGIEEGSERWNAYVYGTIAHEEAERRGKSRDDSLSVRRVSGA